MAEPARVPTRSACVIADATPAEVATVATADHVTLRANRLGTLATGRPGDLVLDWAAGLPGPVYDLMFNASTGWFAVTLYRPDAAPTRWDNRPDDDAGYPRESAILGASTPRTILAALDVPADALGYAEA